jgi:predicted RNase H-like nuclease (RuvC/YqgF family)
MKLVKTIDEKHSEFVAQFAKNCNEIVPKLREEIDVLKMKLKSTKKNIDNYMDTKDSIRKKKQEVKTLLREERDYYLDNSKYVFNYFEQKKEISSGGGNTNVLHSFFKIKTKDPEKANPQSDKYNQSRKTYQAYWRNVTNDYINIQSTV